MKKKFLTMLVALALCSPTFAQWKPAGDKLKTPWGEQLNPKNVLPEYPRPIMERPEWKNLNGSWNYAITQKGESMPGTYQGDILVPFAIESALSGVGKTVNENQELWYKRSFDVPSAWNNKQVLLHFGAVDWKADVWVNDVKVGEHTGGFTPFYFDITSALNRKGNNQLVVKVWDPADRGEQPRGKQVERPGGIWYTPVTGIWQTVWLEPVAEQPDEVTNEYIKYADHLLELIEKGFSAAVYTQITDVEEEVNGLVTYDRKVIKVDEPRIKAINQKICNSLNK